MDYLVVCKNCCDIIPKKVSKLGFCDICFALNKCDKYDCNLIHTKIYKNYPFQFCDHHDAEFHVKAVKSPYTFQEIIKKES